MSLETIDPLRAIRLGMTESDSQEDSLSKYGRSKPWQRHRDELLEICSILFTSLGINNAIISTCDSALYLYRFWIEPFLSEATQNSMFVPFIESDFYKALGIPSESFTSYICSIFDQIKECLPFEVLRNEFDRANYVLARKARFIATTFTHVALKRADFQSLSIQCSTLIIEEQGNLQK